MTAHDIDEPPTSPAAGDPAIERLSPPAARLHRLLAWHPGREFPSELAAALHGGADGEARTLLAELNAAGRLVLDELGAGVVRWRMDDLVRLEARRLAEQRPAEGQRAMQVICRWYLDAVVAADQVAAPGRWRWGPRYRNVAPGGFEDATAAADWLAGELPTLLAVLRLAHGSGHHKVTWQLCEALSGVLDIRRPYEVWVEAATLGLDSARLLTDARAQACTLLQLGSAHLLLSDHRQAEAMFDEALGLARARGHRPAEAAALHRLGQASLRARRVEAYRHLRKAAAIYRDLGLNDGVGRVLLSMGDAYRQAGGYRDATRTLGHAAELLREIGDPHDELRLLLTQAHTDLDAGQDRIARRQLDRALARARELGAPAEQAQAHELLARLLNGTVGDGHANSTAQKQAAHAHLRAARDLYTELGDHTAAAQLET